jgi:hypothetical protein
MKTTTNANTYRAKRSARLVVWLLLLLVAPISLAVAIPSAEAAGPYSGPPNPPQLGNPPVPDAGWQAQEIGRMQPWWQNDGVTPSPPSIAQPTVKRRPSMYDTGSDDDWGD